MRMGGIFSSSSQLWPDGSSGFWDLRLAIGVTLIILCIMRISTRFFIALRLALVIGGSLVLWGHPLEAGAAKKYYPPGFTPPPDSVVVPGESAPASKPPLPPPSKAEPSPPAVNRPAAPVKPKDPLTALLQERRFSEALRLVDQRLHKSPGNLGLRMVRAQILREKQNFEQSEREYRLILGKNPGKKIRAQAFSGLGLTQLYYSLQTKRLGDFNGAQSLLQESDASFKQALRLEPTSIDSWVGIAQIALSQNRLDEAETDIKKAYQIAPSNSSVLFTHGQVLLSQGKPSAALPSIFKARQHAPRDPRGPLLLGQAFLAMQRYDDAIIQLQLALEAEPDSTEALKLLSTAYESKMKPNDAEMALQKAVSLNPSDSEAALSLLKIYTQRKETEQGILLLKTLLKDQPQQPVYQQALLEQLGKAGRWDELYTQGTLFLTPFFSPSSVDSVAQPPSEEMMLLFLQAAYLEGKGLLNRQEFLSQPLIQKMLAYYTERAQSGSASLEERLGLLLLDPLASLPLLPKSMTILPRQLPVAVKITFLQGDWEAHRAFLQQYANDPSLPAESLLKAAGDLAVLGDYTGARSLAVDALRREPDSEEAVLLARQIQSLGEKGREQLQGLKMLPKKIPPAYWQSMAEEALRLSSGNWQLHAFLADTLLDRREYGLALTQQRLAAQYAPSVQERARWLKKSRKTEEKLGKKN